MRQLSLRVAIFFPLSASIRQIGKHAIVFGIFALFVCYEGSASYAGSAGSKPFSLIVDSHYYPTLGHASDTAVTYRGDVLVSLSANGLPPFPPDQQAGVQIFSPVIGGYMNPCGSQKIINFPAPPPVQSVFGMKVFPHQIPYQMNVGAAVQ